MIYHKLCFTEDQETQIIMKGSLVYAWCVRYRKNRDTILEEASRMRFYAVCELKITSAASP